MKLIFTSLFVIICSGATAMSKYIVQQSVQTDSIHTVVDKAPEFNGGQKKFIKYLGHTLRYPAKSMESNVQGEVVLQVVIETDGTVTQIKVKKSVAADLDAEAVRIMAASPKWIPAQKDGKAVRAYHDIPISFVLAN